MKKTAFFLIICIFLISLPISADTGSEVEIIIKAYDGGNSSLMSMYAIDTDYEVVYTFDDIMNGYVIKTDASNLDAIRELPFVQDACISETIYLPETFESSASSSVGAGALNETGLNGEGTVVAVIDSELDVNHDAFNLTDPSKASLKKSDIADIMTNNTLNITGVTANRVYRNPKIPFAYDYCEKDTDVWDENNIHGTHVTGIIAGNNDTVKGIAPEAQVIFMKVFRTIAGTALGTTADVFAAVEDAVNFGVSSINLSLGVDYALAESSSYNMFKDIIETVKNKGIVISSSAGNLGRGYGGNPIRVENTDYGIPSIPAGFTETLSVGSVNNSVYNAYTISLSGNLIPINEGNGNASFCEAFSDKEYEYAYVSYGTKATDYIPSKGKIALIEAHTPENMGITASAKLTAAKNAGALGGIIISQNNSYSSLSKSDIPACMVNNEDGELLKNSETKLIKANNYLTKITRPLIEVSDFSSWNYNTDLTLSVDITAPGGMIYSSFPNDLYRSLSGTSMSAPQVSGAAALMDSYIKKNFPAVMGREKAKLSENILMSCAKPIKNKNGIYESPMVQGAGLLDLTTAVSTSSVLYAENGKTKLSLGGNLSDSFSLSFTSENFKKTSDKYDTVSLNVLTDGYYEKDGKNYIGEMIELKSGFTLTTEEISAYEKKYTLDVSLSPEETETHKKIFTNGFFISGYVFLTASDNSEPPLSIPFMGYYGDFRKPPIFDKEGDVYYNPYPTSYLLINNKKTAKPLGYNMFDDSYHPDKRVISPNGDGYNDTLYIYPRFLRNINSLYLMLMRSEYDSASQVIKTGIAKFSGNSYINLPVVDRFTGEILSDGDYFLRMVATSEYNTSYLQTVDYPLVFDTQPPIIHSIEKNENTVKITLSDNQFIQAVVMEASDTEGNEITDTKIPSCDTKDTIINIEFDIENIDLSTLTFTAYDYGYNTKKAVKYEGGKFQIPEGASAGFTVDTDTASDIYFSLYESGVMTDIAVYKNNSTSLSENGILNSESASEVNLLFWNPGTLTPKNIPFSFILI